jgi:hypothetical protein
MLDELRQTGLAKQMAIRPGMQGFRVNPTDHILQVERALRERLDGLATYFTQISFVTFGHGR